MKHKTMQAEALVKALGPADGEPEGTFEAIVSVFGNVDKFGDRIQEKAFDDTLEAWRSKFDATGARLPVIFAHDWGNPMSYVGSADPNEVKALPGRGLYVKGQIEHMDTNPVAQQVYNLMKSGVITEWSFGYNVPKGGETKADDGAWDLHRIDLFEVGPCLKGVNPDTETLGVKALQAAVEREERGNEALAELREKAYAELNIEGSFEAIQDALCDAVRAKYPQPSDPNSFVSTYLIATTSEVVVYQVCYYPPPEGVDDEQMYRATYTFDESGMAHLGDPEPVTVAIVSDDDSKAPDNTTDNVDQDNDAEKADTDVETKADEGEAQPEDRAKLIQDAFALAHAAYPDGVPASVTKEIFKDPAAYIDAHKKALEAAPTPLDRRQAEAKSCWIEAADAHALPEHRERAWAQLSDAYLGEELKAASISVGTNNFPIAKPGHRWDVEPDPEGLKASTERLLKAGVTEQAAQALITAYEKAGEAVPAELRLRKPRAKAWDGSASNYTDSEYAKACVLDRAIGNDSYKSKPVKQRYGLPIAAPGKSYASDPDAAGVHAAAERLDQVSNASAEVKATAARRLVTAYKDLDEDAPDSVVEAAGEAEGEKAEPAVLARRRAVVKSLFMEANAPFLSYDKRQKAWDGAASNYTDEEYAKACILDRGADAGTAKERYGLPIAKPGDSYASDPDPDGVHAAASRIGQVKGASEEQKMAAAKRLAAAYRHLGEDVPDNVLELAGEKTAEESKAMTPSEADRLFNLLRLENAENEVGKAMTADALQAAALDRQLAVEIENFDRIFGR